MSDAAPQEPWYKSNTTWISIGQTMIGLSVMLGYLSPEQGTAITGNLAPVVGGITALLGAAAILTNRTEVKIAYNGKGKPPAADSVPEEMKNAAE